MNIQRMRVSFVFFGFFLVLALAACQEVTQQLPEQSLKQPLEEPPDLTGTLSFDVGSDSGRVETLAITIGDGGTGPYKAILSGDPGLPTHAIYRPQDLSPFGEELKLPIVAFGNGGCRNSSGEFRNFLSDIASHGFLVVAIGPAANAAVMGAEEMVGTTKASQLLDGVDWATRENSRKESKYYGKIDPSKVAVMGQSCGGGQAITVSGDPRVTTSVILNSASMRRLVTATDVAADSDRPTARGEYGRPRETTGNMFEGLNKMARRYNPNAQPMTLSRSSREPTDPDPLKKLHSPIVYIHGGPSDLASSRAKADFDEIEHVPVFLAYQDVGHYPATFREPNGGAFAVAVSGWLKWQLRDDQTAARMFVGPECGLCIEPAWTIEKKNMN